MKFIIFILLSVTIFSAHAQITSTFDIDDEGWTMPPNDAKTGTVTFQATGGNPNGYLLAAPPTYSGTFNTRFYLNAPAKFLGDHSFSFGLNLKVDLQQSIAGTDNSRSDIIITGGGISLHYNFANRPAVSPSWTSYSVALDESSGWRVNAVNGPVATKTQIKQALQSVTDIAIRCKYINSTGYTSGMDNVVLEQRTLAPAPTVSSLSITSGKPGDVVTITGSGFGATISENEVYFGSMASQITNASTTSLTVIVPIGAPYGTITVINKTTGLSKKSLKPFNPTFDGGGRIIPASFKPKIDFPLDAGNTIRGITVADIDSDGWNDLLVAEGATNSISIFLNLGTGGTLSASTFAPKVTLAGAGNGSGLRIIDLDGDGKQDIVTEKTTTSPTEFATFRNTSSPGSVSFEAVELWPGIMYSGSLAAIEDVDGDGFFDLIGQHGNGSAGADLWIAQNISSPGNIEFGASVSYFGGATLDAGAGVTTGDLDNDGIPEIIVTHNFGAQFQIIKNNSTPGTISLGTPFPIVQSINGGIVIADFNLDGKNDLAWKQGYSNDDVHIRLNTNNGGALTATDFGTEIILDSELLNYGAISISDINGDGKPDILISDSRQVGVFENNFTSGQFTTESFIPSHLFEASGNSTYPTGIIAADLNGDQKPEMVVGITNTNPVRILLYENKNIHAPVISVNTVSPLAAPVGATVTITGNNFSTTPSENKVWFGAVEANVLSATPNLITAQVPPGASYAPVSVTKNELTSRYHLPFQTTFGPGVDFDDTHFAPPISFTLTGAQYDINNGDLNRDGKPDILVNGSAGASYAFKNTHTTGAISISSLIADDTLTNFGNSRLDDFDGDGYQDVATVTGRAKKNNSTSTEISFLPEVSLGFGGSIIDFADFNNDGKTDLTVTTDLSGIGDLVVLENRIATISGNFTTGAYGSFSSNFVFNKPTANGGTITGDFDGDGFADIVTTNPTSDNISIYRNLGVLKISNAQFAARVDVTVGDDPYRIYKGDFDSDGKLDLLVSHWTGTSTTLLIVLQNTSTVGNISFSRIDLTNPSVVTIAHVADLDGDGRPEILTTSEAGNRFSIFKNIHTTGALTAASFAAPFNTTVTAPRGITAADLNLDGKPEIIITRAANLLVVYENLIPTTSIAITQQPTSPFNACEGSTATLSTDASGTTNITYQWQKFNSGNSLFENLVNTTTYSGVTTKTLSIANVTNTEGGNYRCLLKGDLVADVTTNVSNVVFNNLPSPPDAVSSTSCGPGSVTLTASGGSPGDYQWYTTSPLTLISGETNETYTTPVLSASTQYAVTVTGTFCKSLPANVTALVNPIPAKPAITSSIVAVGNAITICSTTTLTLSAPAGFTEYLWSDGSITPQISVTTAGTYSVVVKDAQGCSSSASDGLTVTIVAAPCNNSAPVINTTSVTTTIGGQASINLLDLISDADNNLVPSSLSVISQPASGATTTITNGILLIDYSGTNFTGTDQLTIQVCDVFGECVQQQLEIKVIGELVIYNAVSPNGDFKNEIFRLEYIDLIPETQSNKVTIYNRWGSKVFEVENYNNNDRVFKGLNENGNELPSGTYFYKIIFDSGKKAMSGYLELKK